MTQRIDESVVEEAALAWLKTLGYAAERGPNITISDLRSTHAARLIAMVSE